MDALIIVKYICTNYSALSKAFLNTCLSLEHFPTIWNQVTVVFSRKRNKNPKAAHGLSADNVVSDTGITARKNYKIKRYDNS